MATGHGQKPDWTNQQADDWNTGIGEDIPVPFGEDEDLQIADTVAPIDADQTIQAQRPFGDIPHGTHELVITGRLNNGTDTYVNCTVKDPRSGAERTIGYTTRKVTIKIAMASDPKATTLFDLYFPPTSGDPDHALGYWHGIPKGKKSPGWHAHTFRLLVDKAIAPWPQGQPMPPMARSFSNWVGRHFIGTIDPAEPYTDKNGQAKPGSPSLNQRSFRPAPGQTPLNGLGRPAAPANATAATAATAATIVGTASARPSAPQQRQTAQAPVAAHAPVAANPTAGNSGGWDM
jgi:hypothetical protein